MLELAAVAGPRFELRVLARGRRARPAALAAAVEQAARDGIVEELPEPVPACRFTHELVRRAVYDRIPRVRRPSSTSASAKRSSSVHAADLARVLPELAHHFTLAAPVAGAERAVDYNLRAAEAATASAAYREAAARLSTALELGIDDPRERARVAGRARPPLLRERPPGGVRRAAGREPRGRGRPRGARPRGARARPALEPAARVGPG